MHKLKYLAGYSAIVTDQVHKLIDNNKSFYKLCEYMEPCYHQLEFDMRLYLTYLDLVGKLY